MIKIDKLTYFYPNATRPALRDVSLQIQAGEFVLLAGPSGAGKSTLLRCLNGLTPHFSGGRVSFQAEDTGEERQRHQASEGTLPGMARLQPEGWAKREQFEGGRVEVAGIDVLAAGPRRLSQIVGFVFQNPEGQAVLDTVEPEIAFGLEHGTVTQQEMRVRVEEALNLLDLVRLRQRPLTTLSGGERQRVAIAAALVLRPQVLAVDEPTSQLDPQSAEEVLQALVRLNEDLGLTILLVEHRLERVLRYTDRLVYMVDGRMIVDGPVRQAISKISHAPPLARLGQALGWQPLPLTIKEGMALAAAVVGEQGSGRAAEQGDKPALSTPARLNYVVRPGRTRFPEQGDKPALSTPARFQARGVHFAYGREPVLRGVDLTVQPGEAVVLMGRNGSGKSTLLKCLVGLLRPSSGEICLDGRSIHGREVADICRAVAYLPQNPDDLLFADSVADELAITLRNHGLDASQAPLAPGQLLHQLGLTDFAQAYPRDLSVGQRQRVALGAVAVTAPKLWLLDEPTRGLDYEAKRDLIAIWRRWQAAGAGLLLVTHDVELAAQIADRVVILSQGEVIAAGPTADVLSNSPLFAPQVARLFPGRGWLTVEDALAGLSLAREA